MTILKKIENLEDKIMDAFDIAREIAKESPSRELSQTITKLEEAEMWCDKIDWKQ